MNSKILKSHRFFCSVLILLFAFALLFPCSSGIFAAGSGNVNFEKVNDDSVSASLLQETEVQTLSEIQTYEENEIVRVAIYLSAPSTIDQGFSTMGIGENKAAMMYSHSLELNQTMVTNRIEKAIGEDLDVQWNLTLIANIISANVEYGQIEAIENVRGVEKVVIEQCYYPTVMEENEADELIDTNMIFSGDMIKLPDTWAADYYGAGSRIAIVDTGLDTDHQSFSAEAYEYALKENADTKEMSYDAYIESLDLLDIDEIETRKGALNAFGTKGTTEGMYLNTKVPYAHNYASPKSDVTHDDDNAGAHGSHVAGIAAANRYIEKDGEMVDALTETSVAGVAPDAQILVMKVFANAGAMESDIIAGLEDSLILGADTVNLSLGSANPGFSVTYDVLEKVINSDTVVVFSAGNNFDWAYYASNASYLGEGHIYADDVNTHTGGAPGTSTNVFTVASAENTGVISSGTLQLNGKLIDYNSGNQYPHAVRGIPSLDTSENKEGTEYDYVLVETYGAEGDFDHLKDVCKDAIVLVSRGQQINFGIKANRAVEAGAVATLIYNNVPGSINMNMEGYLYDNPCVLITQDNAEKFKKEGTAHDDGKGNTYYTGKVTVMGGLAQVDKYDGYYNMSVFSSWGVTGDLALKPEITGPGGNIYSVDGSSKTTTDKYTTMSGTSMSAPQVSGVGALVSEYISSNDYKGNFANPHRGLIQSLMMSTAIPITDKNGNYYPLMQQGAGMVNAAGATSADSYIKMSSDATVSFDDGKVKAELGDDPDRTGKYTFAFTLYNLTDTQRTYDLSAKTFVQDTFEEKARADGEYTTTYMDKSTRFVDAAAEFTVDGKSVTAAVLPANGQVTVKATVTLSEKTKEELNEVFNNGTYIQAYIFAEGQADKEGVSATTHSIPMFAFYGNWGDPSMFYAGASWQGEALTALGNPNIGDFSREDIFTWNYEGTTERQYIYNGIHVTDSTGSHMLGGNPLVRDAEYMPERDAMQIKVSNLSADSWLARDASYFEAKVTNLTTGKQKYISRVDDYVNAAWSNNLGTNMGWVGSGMQIDFAADSEGDQIRFNFKALPEYYDEGKGGEEKEPGKGTEYGVTVTLDDTVPDVAKMDFDAESDVLSVSASDNNYVSAVIAYSSDGKEVLAYTGSKADIEKGASAVYDIDLSSVEESDLLVQIFDYAANMATYRVDLSENALTLEGASVAYDRDTANWVQVDKVWPDTKKIIVSERTFNAAAAVGDVIFAVTDKNELYVLNAVGLGEQTFVKVLDYAITDLAYNPADETLYGVTDQSLLVSIHTTEGTCSVVGGIPFETNTLACAEDGTFYSNKYGTGEVYAYTLKTIASGVSLGNDFNGDGVVSAQDSQALLDYIVDETKTIQNKNAADIDGDGDIDTYDVYLLQDTLDVYPVLVANADRVMSKYLQAMEMDLNSGKLYWASYFTDYMKDDPVGFSYFCEIDPENGDVIYHQDFWNEMTSLVIFDADVSSKFQPLYGVTLQLNLSSVSEVMALGEKEPLDAGVTPWNVENNEILWSSSDSSVATVDENGVVTATGYGECEIIAVAAADNTCSASCNVVVQADGDDSEDVLSAEIVSDACGVVNNDVKESYLSSLNDKVDITLSLNAAEGQTNGLQRVSFDNDTLDLIKVSADGLLSYTVNDGKVTIGVVTDTPKNAGESLVTLTFRGESCVENNAVIGVLEENNVHVNTESALLISGHSWGDWSVVKEATETETGKEVRNCSVCRAEETREIPVKPAPPAAEDPDANCPSEKFADLDTADDCWYHKGVDYVLNNGYMKGVSESEFAPNGNVSRGQLVTILYRVEGEPSVDGMNNPFSDLTQDWYKNAVIWAANKGIVKGVSETEFAPELAISREQIATILYRYSGESVGTKNSLTSFKDGAKVSDYAVDAMNWAVEKGLISGTKAGNDVLLDAKGTASRAQISTILMRYLER